jgi:hypothetical protein
MVANGLGQANQLFLGSADGTMVEQTGSAIATGT